MADIDYSQRAGLNPKPEDYQDDWSDAHADHEFAAEYTATSGRLFWADISEFQPVVNSQYPWPQLSIRLDTGWRLDNNAKANFAFATKSSQINVLMGYVVFIPGQNNAILSRIKNNFGAQPEMAIMVDMESGSGFAGPGNHSTQANDLINQLNSMTGMQEREVGYANAYDWANCWPQRPSWLKRVTANYGTQDPGTWGWQYHGGSNYPVPSGFPRAVAPFGSWVDLNTARLDTEPYAESLGLDWLSMATKADVQAAVLAALQSPQGQNLIGQAVLQHRMKNHYGGTPTLEFLLGYVDQHANDILKSVGTIPGATKV